MIVAGIDTETTGLLKPEHRLVEIHIQKWKLDNPMATNPELLSDKTWRTNPDRSIDAKAQAVHHIAIEDLAGAPKLEDVLLEIIAHMKDVDLWVAHNVEFDRNFMALEVERVDARFLPWLNGLQWFDTMTEGRWAHPWGKVPSLQEACWASDVPYDPTKAHAAEYDVTCMMKCFFFGLRTGFYKI
jgi:DNA polymerase-3 subunit epsilon